MKTLRDLMNLQGRVALLTGGAGHIGVALAQALAELGAQVILLDHSAAALEAATRELRRDTTADVLPYQIDLADEASLRAVPERIQNDRGRLDILVHCAALAGTTPLQGWAVPFAEQSSATWRQALEVNLTAPFVLTQACRALLAASGHGSVIHISSIYGLVGPDLRLYTGTQLGNPAAYAASKGALVQMTRWLSTVLAPDIRVNSISPGGVWRQQAESFHAEYIARTPLQRMATEEDFKGAVAYLASDLSRYVTGHNLVVDGGWTAW